MKSRKRVSKIPVDKIDEGKKLCLKNASQFCADADILLKHKSNEHALGLCILATEELGKAIMLKEKEAYARKRSEETVTFRRGKREDFFEGATRKDLKKMGSKRNDINPFYDHLSKLLYAKKMLSLASFERIMRSLEGKWFQTIDEFMEKASGLTKQNQEARTDLREQAFYVDYCEEQGTWSKGMNKIDQAKMEGFISDIQKSIRLIGSS